MGKKAKRNVETTKQSIVEQFEIFRQGFTESCPLLYENLIGDLGSYIEDVSNATPETYIDHIALANQALRAITWSGNPLDNNIVLSFANPNNIVFWDSNALLEISETDNWTTLHNYIEEYGDAPLYFGYLTIFLVNVIRLDIDCKKLQSRDPLLVNHADLILRESHTEKAYMNNKDLIERAQNRLNVFSMNIFNKKHLPHECRKISDAEELTSFTVATVMSSVPADTTESLLRAVKGDINITHSPKAAAEKYSKEFKKYEVYNKQPVISLNTPHKMEDSEISHLDIMESTVTPDPEIHALRRENGESKRELFTLVRQYINDPVKLTDRQRQILTMRYMQDKDVILPYRAIADDLGLDEKTVRGHHDAAISKLHKLISSES